jgi:hypothetical protein
MFHKNIFKTYAAHFFNDFFGIYNILVTNTIFDPLFTKLFSEKEKWTFIFVHFQISSRLYFFVFEKEY